MTTVSSYAAMKRGAALSSFSYSPKEVGPFDVAIAISHCGICHSDVHLVDNDWGISEYPLVPGHEVVGTVNRVGESVTHLKPGDRVGVGWQRSSCLQCEWCISGRENLCSQSQATCVGHFGGFADSMITDSRFAFKIPQALDSAATAPLLCGGITVFSPFRKFSVAPGARVGVIGIGGLGHLALRFARAFGCEVTAISSSTQKEKDAIKFGAHHFLLGSDARALKAHRSHFDFILNTAHATLDWKLYLDMLRPDGTLCFVGVPPDEVKVPVFALVGGRKSICGSPIGGRAQISEMLEFCAVHQVMAQVETVPMSQANEALERTRKNKAHYRMVLKNG